MGKMINFEIVKFGPYRFVGKSVYARAGMACGPNASFAGYLWDNSDWVFEELDKLPEYAVPEEFAGAAFLTWEKYCDKTKLLGYTIGRIMKADTPVPELPHGVEGLDYFDIPETYVAKGQFDEETGNEEGLVDEAIKNDGGYIPRSDKFMVETGPEDSHYYYIACDKKD